jgi:stealth protein CR2
MDALYLFKHSVNDDFEIRHSLRSIEQYAPYIRKVWIFGDKPKFISDDASLIEHVPHEATSWILGVKTPVTNCFLMLFLGSLIPDLAFEFLFFCDDFYFLKLHAVEEARKDRYLEDLSLTKVRGRGLWKDALWRTYDLLIRLGYTGYNGETHTPTYMTRKRVMAAYREFKDFVTEDRFYGMLAQTAILNHAHKLEKTSLTNLLEEKSRCGFWGKPPPYEDVVGQSEGKLFFNFDDAAFGESIRKFLMERFPNRSRYEKE